jgi:transporter family protein
MELWFILALVAVLLWGSTGIFAKLSTPKLGVARVAVLIAVVEGTMYFLAFCYWRGNVSITFGNGVLATGACVLGVIAYLCFFESIMDGQIAIVGTISAAYPALTVVGALVLLSETLTASQAIGLVATVGGVVALSYEPHPGSEHAMPRRSAIFALLAFMLWGFWGLTSKMAVDRVGPGNILGFYAIATTSVPMLYAWLRRVRLWRLGTDSPPRAAWALGATGLAFSASGTFAYSFALGKGAAALVVPISSAYPLVTVVLAVALLHEKLSWLHVIALVAVLIGLIVIGITA